MISLFGLFLFCCIGLISWGGAWEVLAQVLSMALVAWVLLVEPVWPSCVFYPVLEACMYVPIYLVHVESCFTLVMMIPLFIGVILLLGRLTEASSRFVWFPWNGGPLGSSTPRNYTFGPLALEKEDESLLNAEDQDVIFKAEPRTLNITAFSVDPDIYYVENFITAGEAERMIAYARNEMTPSTVVEQGTTTTAKYRSSRSAWFSRDANPIVRQIDQRIHQLLGVPLQEQLDEKLQVLHYNVSGEYQCHQDPFEKKVDRPHAYDGRYKQADSVNLKFSSCALCSPYNRFATIIIYLQPAAKGGGTRFCQQDLEFQPKPYAALFWYNLNYRQVNAEWAAFVKSKPPPTNEQINAFWNERMHAVRRDPRFEHAGMPVVSGEKYIVNKWVHYRRHPSVAGQFFP